MSSSWIIIYPCGNRKKISIAEICDGMEYEIVDYDVASRRRFYSEEEASKYAIDLAREHNKEIDLDGYNEYLD